jgi:hypothetical protein
VPTRPCWSRRSTCCDSACTRAGWRRGSSTCRSGAPRCSPGWREAHLTGDPGLAALHRELAALPGGFDRRPPDGIAVPLRVRHGGEVLSFLSTVTTFGTAVDLTAAELSIEAFLPADAVTAGLLRGAQQAGPAAREHSGDLRHTQRGGGDP